MNPAIKSASVTDRLVLCFPMKVAKDCPNSKKNARRTVP